MHDKILNKTQSAPTHTCDSQNLHTLARMIPDVQHHTFLDVQHHTQPHTTPPHTRLSRLAAIQIIRHATHLNASAAAYVSLLLHTNAAAAGIQTNRHATHPNAAAAVYVSLLLHPNAAVAPFYNRI
eukprot:GDKI01041946.1.p1 GENE.GDKI01041946.1~~GDKI01041946.1.p1  ORF type:complete len:126 (-),score=36.70 GDKI01041946.1:295-672(-)